MVSGGVPTIETNIEMRPAGPMPSGIKESIVWNIGQGSSVPSVRFLLCRIAQRSTYQSLYIARQHGSGFRGKRRNSPPRC
jgi:hypothetical protein